MSKQKIMIDVEYIGGPYDGKIQSVEKNWKYSAGSAVVVFPDIMYWYGPKEKSGKYFWVLYRKEKMDSPHA